MGGTRGLIYLGFGSRCDCYCILLRAHTFSKSSAVAHTDMQSWWYLRAVVVSHGVCICACATGNAGICAIMPHEWLPSTTGPELDPVMC